jgi:hypothetical protein
MNDIKRTIDIDDINHLNKSAAHATTPDGPLPIATSFGIRCAGSINNQLGLFNGHAMLCRMLTVPFIPPKRHQTYLYNKIIVSASNFYF